MAGGRPLLFPSVTDLQVRIDDYFNDNKNKPFTLAGLAYHLDCCTVTLRNYSEKEEFFSTIKKARQRCEVDLMQMMLNKNIPTAGCIFQAVNNHGYINNSAKVDHGSSDGSMSPTEDARNAVLAAIQAKHDGA